MLQKIKGIAGRFLRDTRGGATSIAAVAVTIMTMGGAALIIDHNHLVGQRDILKSASDAASLAATLELNKLPDTLDDDEVRDRILPIARKYATLNVLGNVSDPDITADNVSIAFDINRGLGIVGATVEADTGKTLMSSWLYGYFGPGTVSIESGVETSETTVEVVLAIDISNSMHTNLAGDDVGHEDPESRMSIVKQAAADLVTILAPSDDLDVAVGIVPWDVRVRLDWTARGQWASNGWAVYPARRYFAATYKCEPENSCTPVAATDTLRSTPPETWKGCLDEHRVTAGLANTTPESDWFDPPSDKAFAQGIYPPAYGRAYRCVRNPRPSNFDSQRCYGQNVDSVPSVRPDVDPQSCGGGRPSMLPLTTDRTDIADFIDALKPAGGATYSALGLLWSERLLTPDWRDVWGDDVYPVDRGDDVRKAIVLLTDGADTQCGPGDPGCSRNNLGYMRAEACTAVKAAGTEIFVVAAMSSARLSGRLGRELTACSSQGERDGTYVFINHENPESLRAAFTEIASQLRTVRRIF